MNILSSVSPLKYSERELLSFLLNDSFDRHLPVALWRLPGSGIKHVIVSGRCHKLDTGAVLEQLPPGFMMAPFDKDANRYFLPADQYFNLDNDGFKTGGDVMLERSAEWLSEQLLKQSQSPGKVSLGQDVPAASRDQAREPFKQIVQKCIEEIEKGTFEKIVPSRTRTLTLPESFDIVDSFQKLCASYPQALISFVNIPGVGKWLGASPELLVCVQDKTIFKTVALAGTLPYQAGVDIKSVAWTQKEIEEQALVERYVISCFKKIRLREYEEHGPKTVIAGNLMHLKSEFTVDMKATNFPQIGSVMLQLLHPTSAVCGMPLETSLSFLKKHEGYDRAFYAGYLGPVNINNNIDLFVNLRCMQIAGHSGILYAGAGVTIDSIPEREWAETEMKFNTLLNVIV
jgi:isochorismate synthase